MFWYIFSQVASACAACGYGPGKSQRAFFSTMLLLTFVPLIVMGAIAGYIVYKARVHGEKK